MTYILIVEDEELVRELFNDWLTAAGYRVEAVDSAVKARDVMSNHMPDVVVSDIRMARETGLDLLAWIRERDPDLPVILVTGVPAVETAVEALRHQAYDYLVKPISEEMLRRVVARAVEHRQLLREKRRLEEENLRYQQHLEALVAERTATLERRTRQLLLIHQIAQNIGRIRQVQVLYEQVVTLLQRTFKYANVDLFEVDPAAGRFILRASAGAGHSMLQEGYTQSLDEGLMGRCYREKRPLIVNDVSQHEDFVPLPDLEVKSEALFPIQTGDKIAAILVVDEYSTNAFDDTDEIVLTTLANYLAISLENARLFRDLQQALQAREEMFNNVSHELRTPLTIIRGYAELMVEGIMGSLDEEAHEAIRTILEQARHLTSLVDQLIAFRAMDREGIPLEPINFSEWLLYALNPWHTTLAEHNLHLEVDVPRDLGTIQGNVDYLQRVINNLLDNARKFSHPGGTVYVRAWRKNREVFVSVSDEGIGVDPSELPRIFDRFYQVDKGTTRKYGGMGLGLALVREIIEHHKGRVWANSEGKGKGLTVTFALPLVDTS